MAKLVTLLKLTSTVALISGSAIPELRPADSATRFHETRERIKSLEHSLPYRAHDAHAQLITDDTWLTSICKNNVDGNYLNPLNNNQFLMCSNNNIYLWSCPDEGVYDPIRDTCVHQEQGQGASSSMWIHPDQVRCDTLGQRSFWSPITLPAKSRDRCSRNVFYCKNYKTVGTATCPEGFGYSKAYLACIEIEECYAIDNYFQL